jgi:hypothetical protein
MVRRMFTSAWMAAGGGAAGKRVLSQKIVQHFTWHQQDGEAIQPLGMRAPCWIRSCTTAVWPF